MINRACFKTNNTAHYFARTSIGLQRHFLSKSFHGTILNSLRWKRIFRCFSEGITVRRCWIGDTNDYLKRKITTGSCVGQIRLFSSLDVASSRGQNSTYDGKIFTPRRAGGGEGINWSGEVINWSGDSSNFLKRRPKDGRTSIDVMDNFKKMLYSGKSTTTQKINVPSKSMPICTSGGGITWGGKSSHLSKRCHKGRDSWDVIDEYECRQALYSKQRNGDFNHSINNSHSGMQQSARPTLNGDTRRKRSRNSGGGVCWDGDSQNYYKIQAAVAAAAVKMPRPLLPGRFSLHHSTEENYCSDDMNFFGPHADIRATLDYSYHSNYQKERQAIQDSIIRRKLVAPIIFDIYGDVCSTPIEPWIVFTAGAMGAGKGHTIQYLSNNNYFPLQSFVPVDPDDIRRDFPEFLSYVAGDPASAGERTRKESGYISEIITLAALRSGKNVLVDGSLRDFDWYWQYFARLRAEYPNLRIAVLQISAPRETVLERAAHRALETGRLVPLGTLEAVIDQVPKSVKIIAPLADYFCELYNAPGSDIEILTPGETWESFKTQWEQTCAWIPGRLLNRTRSSVRIYEQL